MGVLKTYLVDFKSQLAQDWSIKMKTTLILISVAVSFAAAQDTFYCPDGWELFQHQGHDHDRCECFWFPITLERVSHGDASLLCQAHDAMLAEPVEGHLNHWIVEQLMKRMSEKTSEGEGLEGPHYEDQWWLGGKSYTKHDTHNPGEWIWESTNTTVDWFDWAPGEPNDYHRQQCLVYIRYDYFGNPTYNWNDWDCNTVADYICQKPCGT